MAESGRLENAWTEGGEGKDGARPGIGRPTFGARGAARPTADRLFLIDSRY
jgi:hypothetical protein